MGVLIAAVGFGLQAAALGLGSLLLVGPLIVLSVLFALPMEAHLDDRRLTIHEWKWGITLTVCVAAFVLLTRPSPGHHQTSAGVLAAVIAVLVVLLGTLVVATRFVSLHYRALLFGAASGVLTGVQSFLVKGLMEQLSEGLWEIFIHPEIYLIIVVAVGSVVAQQMAFAAHDLQTSFPAMTVVEPAVAMTLGVLLLGERAQVGIVEGIFVGALLLLTFYATVVLAKHAAEREVVHEMFVEHERAAP